MAEHTYPEYVLLRKGETPPPDSHEVGVRLYADTDGALRTIQSDGTDAAIGGGSPLALPIDLGLFKVAADGTIQSGADNSWHVVIEDRTITLYDSTDQVRIELVPGSRVTINDTDGVQLFYLDLANKLFYISPGGTNAFAVYDDGSVHIKTGTTIQADL